MSVMYRCEICGKPITVGARLEYPGSCDSCGGPRAFVRDNSGDAERAAKTMDVAMGVCGRCAGYGVIRGVRFDPTPVTFEEPCPDCRSVRVYCFFNCGYAVSEPDPDEAHNHMEAHYEVGHRDALETLYKSGVIR